MKKAFFIALGIFSVSTLSLKAQCVIDYTQTQPGIYPNILPSGMVGETYSEGITFVMPLDTSGFNFTNFYIQSVSGLPLGLSWQCNSPSTNCSYNPQSSQHGCIEVSGTPLLAGTYQIDVSVIATLSLIGDIPANFYTQVVIEPDTSSNAGFTSLGSYGCSPMTVSFINNNPGLAGYNWDFGNGTTSTQENPGPQTYSSPGEYVVNYDAYLTTTPSYFLTNIVVLEADGWNGDADDGFGALSPDPYVKLLDQSGSIIYTSPVAVDQNFPVSWDLGNIPLQNQNYTIEVWDEDGFWTGDDFCGSLVFQGFSGSGTITGGGETINYTNTVVSPIPITASDTIQVFNIPSSPNIDSLGLQLWTDSLNLTLQWYQNGNALLGETSDSLLVSESGDYCVVSSTLEGCFSTSDTLFIVVCDSVFSPSITQNGHLLYTDTSSYLIQWYQDGLPISGGTSQLLQNITEGDFWVELTSYDGCTYLSEVISVDFTSIEGFDLSETSFSLYPNPTAGEFSIRLIGAEQEKINLQVLDLSGRIIFSQTFFTINKSLEEKFILKGLPGVYMVRVDSGTQSIQKKLLIK
jgi:PKD repeat protein